MRGGLIGPLIKLVVFLVVTFLFTYVLAATISNASFGDTNSYKAIFSDVTGLEQGDDVRIAGVRVGTVDDITIVRRLNKPAVAQVSFTVQKSRPLPADVQARLRYRNLVGQRYVDVEQGPGNANKMLAPGGTIPLNHTKPAVDLTVLVPGLRAAGPGPGRQRDQPALARDHPDPAGRGRRAATAVHPPGLADRRARRQGPAHRRRHQQPQQRAHHARRARQRALPADHPAARLHPRSGRRPHHHRQRDRRHQQPGHLDRRPADPGARAVRQGRRRRHQPGEEPERQHRHDQVLPAPARRPRWPG